MDSRLKLNALELRVASVKVELKKAESAELNLLLSVYEDLLGDDMGEMKDFQTTLELKQGAVLNFFLPRSMPSGSE